jgi:hypothetical protein
VRAPTIGLSQTNADDLAPSQTALLSSPPLLRRTGQAKRAAGSRRDGPSQPGDAGDGGDVQALLQGPGEIV